MNRPTLARCLIPFALALAAGCNSILSQFSPAPMEPEAIPPTSYSGWVGAFCLDNGAVAVTAVPSVGRILSIGLPDGANALRNDLKMSGFSFPDQNEMTWLNVGGDWLWPVAQSQWPKLGRGNWPPPAVLTERPWQGSAWIERDGSKRCLLTRQYGEPLNVKVSRLITVPKKGSKFHIRQTIERTAASTHPVSISNVSQVGGARRLFIPVDAESAFKQGYRVLSGQPPGDMQMVICGEAHDRGTNAAPITASSPSPTGGEGRLPAEALAKAEGDGSNAPPYPAVLVLSCDGPGDRKLGSDSRRAWVAVQKGNMLLIERVVRQPAGAFPDGGCAAEVYARADAGYADIQLVSPEKDLKPGERLENEIEVECRVLALDPDPCKAAQALRQILGEGAVAEQGRP